MFLRIWLFEERKVYRSKLAARHRSRALGVEDCFDNYIFMHVGMTAKLTLDEPNWFESSSD